MRRLAWTFAARIGDKYQIRLTRSNYSLFYSTVQFFNLKFLSVIDFSLWYRKFPKYSDTQKIVVITLKVEQDGVSLE